MKPLMIRVLLLSSGGFLVSTGCSICYNGDHIGVVVTFIGAILLYIDGINIGKSMVFKPKLSTIRTPVNIGYGHSNSLNNIEDIDGNTIAEYVPSKIATELVGVINYLGDIK